MKHLAWVHFTGTILATTMVIAAMLIAHHSGLLKGMDRFIYDLQIRLTATGAVSDDVLLVLMDTQSAVRLDRRRGGWSRTHLSAALDHLCRSNAATIGIDLVLAAPDPDPAADARLAAAIERCGNVVLARVSVSGGQPVQPLAPFLNVSAGDGFIDLPPDSDDVLRRVPFFNAVPAGESGIELVPSFSLELARVFRGLSYTPDFSEPDYLYLGDDPSKRLRLPYPDLLIRFTGDYRSFDHEPFSSVVEGLTDASRIQGKLVVIGSQLAIEKDYFSTPFSRFNRIAATVADKFGTVLSGVLSDKDIGVACQAAAAQTILSGSAIRRAAPRATALWTAAAGIAAMVFYLPAVGSLAATLILVAALAATTAGGVLAMNAGGIWLDTAPAAVAVILQFVCGTALQKTLQRRRTRWLTDLFGKYVSPEVAGELMNSDMSETLAGASRDVTLLFADLRDFTAHSERLGPVKTRALLNRYFQAMIPLVFANRGTLDKLMGDAVMAFFGAPLQQPDHPDHAADCALQMVRAVKALQSDPAEDARELRMGVGINSGSAIVGNLGTDAFMDYTAIGDTVNLASRLEGLNKHYDTRIIIGPETSRRLSHRFVTRRIDRARVAGRDAPADIYELVGYRSECPADLLEGLKNYEKALAAYQGGDLQLALRLAADLPDDGPARWLTRRLTSAQQSPACEPCLFTDFQTK
ncbi:MAG: adenylate/guanylate cyclase domain-containing protein [Pseudomonadota bacterium]